MRSFRDLLAIRFAVLTTLSMTVCVAGVLLILRRSLDTELDANILNVASIQAAALTDGSNGQMHFHEWDLTPDEAASVQELVRYAQVWSEERVSLLRSQYMTGDLPTIPETLSLASGGQLLWEKSTFDGAPVRSVLYPLARLGGEHDGHVLQVAAPLTARNALLRRATLSGMILVLLVAVGSVVGGRWLADQVVHPVSEIIDEAEAVGGNTLRRRISTHANTREYQRLVLVLNRMLDRIQSAFETQRRFTADASHELRSPLTAMRGELELALRRERQPAEYRETLESAREEVVRLSGIVEGLLVLARSDSGAIEPRLERVDLGELARKSVERMSEAARVQGVHIDLNVPEPVSGVFDPGLVGQMAENLIMNAVRFAGVDGRVQVSVSSRGHGATLCVEDSGEGIPPGAEQAIFERFWRADESRAKRESGGTGLGLAIVKVIAEAHEGSVSASNESSLGGARFEVWLPVLATASKGAPPNRKEGTVLSGAPRLSST